MGQFHLGFPQEVELLRQVTGVDICLSGHTHNRLYQSVLVGQTMVIQSGLHGSFLGRLDLTVEGKRVTSYRHRLIAITPDLHPDDEVEGMISTILEPSREFLGQVVGETATPLDRGGMLETTMDNLLLQSIVDLTGAEVAFSNGWRYGAPVPSGPVKMNDLYNIIPENPPVSMVNLTGYEIKEILEENLERTF
ncbi:MAG: 5'-nucleotidase C-terminal domain-containing protein [Firmicutes bacterium]|nr:5'-nucleotidase C-terminal domain-containing protein [Bacillota bacterium]MCL5039638.1 5'-nucleotidase C-terminal domain-containing protein [Bacillota bacterium]